ncbi:hypothetical protein CVT25_009340 [Psilocybe cyanescens]|uniref:Uncharacterized protein n=1 Tax=Psilocybe cyanescens TaxID=93625 RepID=A0A409VN83_PSICY|nr:hypothetical protein CVT25_009340 [Psilocybe cyanescens]
MTAMITQPTSDDVPRARPKAALIFEKVVPTPTCDFFAVYVYADDDHHHNPSTLTRGSELESSFKARAGDTPVAYL